MTDLTFYVFYDGLLAYSLANNISYGELVESTNLLMKPFPFVHFFFILKIAQPAGEINFSDNLSSLNRCIFCMTNLNMMINKDALLKRHLKLPCADQTLGVYLIIFVGICNDATSRSRPYFVPICRYTPT
jgi:hypothetical protein